MSELTTEPARSASRLPAPPEPGRSDRKRQSIMEAATLLFLRKGYQGTSMDEIAAVAGVSKQTVYKQFTDKEQLFRDIVFSITNRADEIVRTVGAIVDATTDTETGLRELARRYASSVTRPQVLQLRRLVIGEADRFPDLARAYFEQAPERGIAAVAAGLSRLSERNLLRVGDPVLAASQFAYLVLGLLLDRAMFYGNDSVTSEDIERAAEEGVRVFLAAYGW